jgi:hypothetical protein
MNLDSREKHSKLQIGTLITVTIFALLFAGITQVQANTTPVRVPADSEWVDTGIMVYAGQEVKIKVNGQAITGPLNEYPDAKSGPEGQSYLCSDLGYPAYACALEGGPYGALIGRIGADGEPFYIGDASSIIPSADGVLYLIVNDNTMLYDDNNSGFTVLFK